MVKYFSSTLPFYLFLLLICFTYGIQHCASQSGGKCNTCDSGWFPSDDKYKCIPVIPNCKTQVKYVCSACQSYYILSPDGYKCIQAIPNCADQAKYICNSCSDGYILSDDQYKCIQKIDGCVSQTKYICNTCDKNYLLVDEGYTCYCAQPGIKPDGSVECVSCVGDFRYDAFFRRCKPWTYYCANMSETTGLCITCIPEYEVVSGKCFKSIENCLNLTQDGQNCLICNNSTILSIDGQCIDKEPETNCSENYFRNASGLCERYAVQNCQRYNQEGLCIYCRNGYKLDTQVNSTTCTYLNDHCSHYFGRICYECQDGYYPHLGVCYKYN